jgi:hypothetical protein
MMAMAEAARAELRPKMRFLESELNLNISWESQAAAYFPPKAKTARVLINIQFSGFETRPMVSTIIPILIRKKGMNSVLPIKTTRFISGDVRGIKRFKDKPVKKAPIRGSIPRNSAMVEEIKIAASINIY